MTEPATSPDSAAAVAERLRRRYPTTRMPRPIAVVLIALGSAVALGWLIWAAYAYATPAVDAKVAGFTVTSNTTIDVTLTVERRDPARAATCRVLAQSADFQPVAEQQIAIPAGTVKLVDTHFTLTTLRRAVTAVVKTCEVS